MKKNSLKNMRKKEQKLSVIALGMMRNNKLEKMIRKERWINVYKLQMKEAVFLIMSKCVVWLIPAYLQHELSD